jgi:hypothetical protein
MNGSPSPKASPPNTDAAEHQDPQVSEALQAARDWLALFRRQPHEMSEALRNVAHKLQAIRETSRNEAQWQWRVGLLRAELLKSDSAADIFFRSLERLRERPQPRSTP